jgi:hypothetical protein
LWRKPRWWRVLTLSSLAAFAAVVNLHDTIELLWMSRGSKDVLATLVSIQPPSAILTHVFAPAVLVACLGYVVLSLRTWQRADQRPAPAPPGQLPE